MNEFILLVFISSTTTAGGHSIVFEDVRFGSSSACENGRNMVERMMMNSGANVRAVCVPQTVPGPVPVPGKKS